MLAVTPLLTRLYLPQDFGLAALLMAIASVIWTVSSGRYELAIALPKNHVAAHQVWVLAQLLNLAVALSCAFSWLFAKAIANLANAPGLDLIWWTLPLYILFAGWYRANNYMALRDHQYPLIAKSKITQSGGSALGQVAAFWLSASAQGLVLGQIIGQALGAWQLARLKNLGWRQLLYLSQFKKRWYVMAKRYKRFPIYDVPAALIDVLSVQLPNLLLASFFGANIAGFYMLAERMVALPIALVGQSVGQVLFGFSRQALGQGQMFKMALKAYWF
jgi:O-antigen/teichoic acid export membrane protein